MRKLLYKVLLAGIIIPLVSSISNAELSDQQQKNLIHPNVGPILNSINTSQDGSTSYKPFPTVYTNTIYGQSLISSPQLQSKQQQPPLVNPVVNVQPNYASVQQGPNSQIKQTPPQPLTPPIPLQPNFASIGQTPYVKQQSGTPLQSTQPLQPNIPVYGQTGPTPVILQYLPQANFPGAVQYLQLIPTRPLIVPISPYIAQIPTWQIHQKSQLPNSNGKIGGGNDQMPSATKIISQGNPPIGFSNTAAAYKFFRPNSGMELINPPNDLNFNTNEFLPAFSDPSATLNKLSQG